jgi:hypothetical protein
MDPEPKTHTVFVARSCLEQPSREKPSLSGRILQLGAAHNALAAAFDWYVRVGDLVTDHRKRDLSYRFHAFIAAASALLELLQVVREGPTEELLGLAEAADIPAEHRTRMRALVEFKHPASQALRASW